MNSILDTAGALLYALLRIVLIPLFVLTDLALWSIVAFRVLRGWHRRLMRMRLHAHWPLIERQWAFMRKRAFQPKN